MMLTKEQMINVLTQTMQDNGIVVRVPRGARLAEPIQLQALVEEAEAVSVEHITIIVEEDAHAIIHDIVGFVACLPSEAQRAKDGSKGGSVYTSTSSVRTDEPHTIRSIKVTLHDHAQVTFVQHQARSASTHAYSTLHFTLNNHSVLQYASLLMGGHYTKIWLDVVMRGEHAQVDMSGVWLLDGASTIDVTTTQQHLGAHNTSKLCVKSAVRDAARSIYRGTVHIAENASGTYAAQENKNILLSERASACSIPNLQALNNDVYCAHGTAVGQLDAEQLLYLQARGIAYKQAQRMLLQGFLADAIPDHLGETVHATLSKSVAQWLGE